MNSLFRNGRHTKLKMLLGGMRKRKINNRIGTEIILPIIQLPRG
jgi:pentatricopeptide repeat protein